MARLESTAVGGYFPTYNHLIPRIACCVEPYVGNHKVAFLDPCAGTGDAILSLMQAVGQGHKHQVLYAVEMEKTRFDSMRLEASRRSYDLTKNLVHGNAFQVQAEKKTRNGISILFLNPPYDLDRVHGRLETKFLDRFTPTLVLNGILFFIVPYYTLASAAQILGTEYGNIHCFKYPDPEYQEFKQVVLFAQKVETRRHVDPSIVTQVEGWSKNPETLPELPNIASNPLAQIPAMEPYEEGLGEFTLRAVDTKALLTKVRPWMASTRTGSLTPVRGVFPELPIDELLLRRYPVATPVRPAHIAAGIAAGVFNGSLVTAPGMPDLLVKGVFSQEFVTVEERTNKKGETTGYVQVQQPRLVVTVLDLSTHQYHTLKQGTEITRVVSDMTVSSLLHYYGESLMHVMNDMCPVTYDPNRDGDRITLGATVRPLYTAQQHAVKALVTLLGGDVPLRARRGKAAILLGEIGVGKTTVALSSLTTMGLKRPLVMCPPHLLSTWTEETAKVLPGVRFKLLETITDLEQLSQDNSDGMVVSILSRETGKLSHRWEGVGEACPKCGSATPKGDLAKKRSRCEHVTVIKSGIFHQLTEALAYKLVKYAPKDYLVSEVLSNRVGTKLREGLATVNPLPEFEGVEPKYFRSALKVLLNQDTLTKQSERAIVWILMALNDVDLTATVADQLLGGLYSSSKSLGRDLLLMLPPGSDRQTEILRAHRAKSYDYTLNYFENSVRDASDGKSYVTVSEMSLSWEGGALTVADIEPASLKAYLKVLEYGLGLVHRSHGEPCGEFLYQAIPDPRRVALAPFITQRYRGLFDGFILDEAHEYSTDGSAQERSAHRLTGLGLPTILMTGSLMNGYAESLFANMWAISADFRKEFSRSDKRKFVDRYGYRKRLLRELDDEAITAVEHGSSSDRVKTSETNIGNAPGVLPLFLLRHLLPISVTLHKADLALELPLCTQERVLVKTDPEVMGNYKTLLDALVKRIRKDRFDPERAGKLFGMLAELPSYMDRATSDTGNTEDGAYEIRYPESLGSEVVVRVEGLPPNMILPKERWMLDCIKREISEGRNVLVFGWHLSLLPRLARIIEAEIGEKVPILYADKVPTCKRQEWITKNIVKKHAKVMIANPVAISTGLNNLVHFSTEIWFENPACNPVTYRQGIGRVDRIGQNKPTRIYFPIYEGSLQTELHKLLLDKVAVSTATDGLDPESALIAAGAGPNEYMTGLSIGKQLWALINKQGYNQLSLF